MRRSVRVLLVVISLSVLTWSQSETATLSGRITDATGSVIVTARVKATNTDTNVAVSTKTNEVGIFIFPGLEPGNYQLTVIAQGFGKLVKNGIVLHVQDRIAQNLALQVGSVDQVITVTAEGQNINTTDATVSTVIDRNFAENLPMNGRSFQTLIDLTPGVVVTPVNNSEGLGQFSVNGQRADANNVTVDGMSANFGVQVAAYLDESVGGAIPATNLLGGYSSLVSVDAMQEFRVQTSSYAPEFGRQPGAQISITTRSGTNQLHGALFDYLRNDVLDANDWFANRNHLPKPEERQNDFGGTLGGPIWRDRTFFFFSYEGLRLRQPQTSQTLVPSSSSRASASSAIAPFVNLFPMPNGADLGNGAAMFNASYSNQSSLNSTSLRLDHVVGTKLTIFGRYNYAPSELLSRGGTINSLNNLQLQYLGIQTATLGSALQISANSSNDLRANYSRNRGTGTNSLDSFGGAVVPSDSLLYPPGFTSKNAGFAILLLTNPAVLVSTGRQVDNTQRQIEVVDGYSVAKGTHAFKFGLDYRRQSLDYGPQSYFSEPLFLSVSQLLSGRSLLSQFVSAQSASVYLNNVGLYLQDSWKVRPKLTLTYGLRWDVEVPPSLSNGLRFLVASNVNDLPNFSATPTGAAPWQTRYNNFAPRLGVAYELLGAQGKETVLRGGFGTFYDLAGSELDMVYQFGGYPFGATRQTLSLAFPFASGAAAPPPIAFTLPARAYVYDPNIRQPYTFEWNGAIERSLGINQTISLSYVGAGARHLLQREIVNKPNASFLSAGITRSSATSNYHALQVQLRRRVSRGMQALASYTWSHSIDTASTAQNNSSDFSEKGSGQNRGSSAFDIRHVFSGALLYDIPSPKASLATAFLGHWSVDNVVLARTAAPVDVGDPFVILGSSSIFVRPDVLPGVPLYLFGGQYPGGKAINPAAFTAPPSSSPNSFLPLRQGNLGRNTLRGFGAWQWDFSVHRDIPIHDALKLQFRAEMFNALNHPNFGPPNGTLTFGSSASPLFGQSQQTLGKSLGGGSGSVSSLYQIGGPRSVQVALKLIF